MMNNSQKMKNDMISYVNSDRCVWSHMHDSIQTNSNKDKIISDYKIHGLKETNLFDKTRTVIGSNATYSTVTEDNNIIRVVPVNTSHDNEFSQQGGYVAISTMYYPVKDCTFTLRLKLNNGDADSIITVSMNISSKFNFSFKFNDFVVDEDGWISCTKSVHHSTFVKAHRLYIYVNVNDISMDVDSIKIIPHSSPTTFENFSVPILISPENLLKNSFKLSLSDTDDGWRYGEIYPKHTTIRYGYDLSSLLEPGVTYTLYFKLKDTITDMPTYLYCSTNDSDINEYKFSNQEEYGYFKFINNDISYSYKTFTAKDGMYCNMYMGLSAINTDNEAISYLNNFEFIRLVKGVPKLERIFIDNSYVEEYIDDPSTAVIQKNVYEYRTGIKLPELYQFEGLTTYEVLEPGIDLQIKSYIKHFWSEAGNPLEVNSTRNTNVKDYRIYDEEAPIGINYNFYDMNNSQYYVRYNANYTIDDNNIMSITGVDNTGSNMATRGIIEVSTGKFSAKIDKPLKVSVRVKLNELGSYDDTFRIDIGSEIGQINLLSLPQDDEGFVTFEENYNQSIGNNFEFFMIYCNGNNISIDLNSLSISYEEYSIPIFISQNNLLPYNTLINAGGWYKPTDTMPNGSTSLKYIYMLNNAVPYNEEITLFYKFKDNTWGIYLYILSNDPSFAELGGTYSTSTGYYTIYLTAQRIFNRQVTFTMKPEYTYYLSSASEGNNLTNMKKWLDTFEYISITKTLPVLKFIYINEPLQAGEVLVKSQNRALQELPQFEEGTTYEIILPNESVQMEVEYL